MTEIREMSDGWAVAPRDMARWQGQVAGAGMENWVMMSPPCPEQPGPATVTCTSEVPRTGTTMTAAGWVP